VGEHRLRRDRQPRLDVAQAEAAREEDLAATHDSDLDTRNLEALLLCLNDRLQLLPVQSHDGGC
jgi:hypothetical protein